MVDAGSDPFGRRSQAREAGAELRAGQRVHALPEQLLQLLLGDCVAVGEGGPVAGVEAVQAGAEPGARWQPVSV